MDSWKYLVREWRSSGPDQELVIVPNGQTDVAKYAFELCTQTSRPRHVYETKSREIIYKNY